MPTVTVTAPDSALAMDEIIRRLGDTAYILSTTSRDGQIEIRATNDPMRVSPATDALNKPTFSTLFTSVRGEEEHVVLNVGRQPLHHQGKQSVSTPPAKFTFSSKRNTSNAQPSTDTSLWQANNASTPLSQFTVDDSAYDKVVENRPSMESHHPIPNTASAPLTFDHLESAKTAFLQVYEHFKVQDAKIIELTAHTHRAEERTKQAVAEASRTAGEIRSLKRESWALRDENDHLKQALREKSPHNTDGSQNGPIVQAGFDAAIVERIQNQIGDKATSAFAETLAKEISMQAPMSLLTRCALVISGASGAGKTVLAVKFANLIRAVDTEANVQLVTLSSQEQNTCLETLAAQLDIPHTYWNLNNLPSTENIDPSIRYVIDFDKSDIEAELPILEKLRSLLRVSELPLIVAMPGGQSPGRIETTLSTYRSSPAQIALTKLDECECDAREISAYAKAGLPVAWLSGSTDVSDTLAPATTELLTDYLVGILAKDQSEAPAMAAE